MRTRKCLYVQRDEGSLCSGAIAASPNGNFYATGSSSGVVNVYKNDGPKAFSTPHKSLMQLTTRIDYLKFNPDSQILAMASKDTKDALKLVHVPSFTVFGNWPSSKTPLHYVSAMDFSPNSGKCMYYNKQSDIISCVVIIGYFACGNARGRVLLYRLTHYGST
jgi:U3 small nucleolar RNA-associated protein 18